MKNEDLPPTPMLERDPFALEIPMFEIPNVDTLKALMQAEQHAVQVVHAKVRSFMEPGMALVGQDGKPMAETGVQLQKKVTAYLEELLLQPTIAEEWAAAPSELGKMSTVTGASFQIAYMVYQEFGRLVNMRCPMFMQVIDAAMLLGMTALHNGRQPVEAYERSFQAKTKDDSGIEVLGQQEAFRQHLISLQNCLYAFLETKGMSVVQAPDAPVVLADSGRRLLNHLASVMGSTESMKQQGPAIMQEVMAAMQTGETRTETQIATDLKEN